ncbi:MAG: diguanylate cyclase, partial [Planctomycetaceae bacterium]|nr:diguanylate cyclase [Planctomycetaceae bacterium]
LKEPFADIVERLVGHNLALKISETMRSGDEMTIPVELGNRKFLLVLKPLIASADASSRYYATYWRGAIGEVQQALLKAKRRIRNLSRDDPVTGLLNASTFREVLAHDWAIAAREESSLALVSFTLEDFDAYLDVFGRHAADSCLRRVAQAIRHCLRRASDVAARIDNDQSNRLVVLSHASEESGVTEFAAKISTAVRELGLHHPRSRTSRFVTVSYKTRVLVVGEDKLSATDFLDSVLGWTSA